PTAVAVETVEVAARKDGTPAAPLPSDSTTLPSPSVSAATRSQAAPSDPMLEAAKMSPQARRGLGAKGALYHRIAPTRPLLAAWTEAGRYLSQPTQRLAQSSEAKEMITQLTRIRDLLRDFPPLLGGAGQPGYLVASLARQPLIVPTFQML